MQNGSAGYAKAPPSTIKLFGDILTSAEAGHTNSSNRDRLFRIATKLVKLNLGKTSSGSKEHNDGVWNIIIAFLQRYPEYSVHRPSALNENGSNVSAESSADAEIHEQSEPMLVWLLPRLLSRLAGITLVVTDHEAQLQKQAIEQWLSSAIALLASQYCNVLSNGVGLQRGIVDELISLLHTIHAYGHSQTVWPCSIAVFSRGAIGLQICGEDDPLAVTQAADVRPFQLLLRSPAALDALHLSLLRILVGIAKDDEIWSSRLYAVVVQNVCRGNAGRLDGTKRKQIASPICVSNEERLGLLMPLVANLPDRPELSYCAVQILDYTVESLRHVSEQAYGELSSLCGILARLLLGRRPLSNNSPLLTRLRHHSLQYCYEQTAASVTCPSFAADINSLCWFAILYTASHSMNANSYSREASCFSKALAGIAPSVDLYLHDEIAVEDASISDSAIEALRGAYQEYRASTEGDQSSRKRGSEVRDEPMTLFQDSTKSRFEQSLAKLGISSHGCDDHWSAQFNKLLDEAATPKEFQHRSAIICLLSTAQVGTNARFECKMCSMTNIACESSQKQRFLRDDGLHLIHFLQSKLTIADSAAWRIAYSRTLRALFNHLDEKFADQIDISELLVGFSARSRSTRLLFSSILTSFCRALAAGGRVCSHGSKQMEQITSTLQRHLRNKQRPASQLSALGLLSDLMCVMPDSGLSDLIALIIVALSAGSHLKAFVVSSLDKVLNSRKVSVLKLFSPHFEAVCLSLARELDGTFSLLLAFSELMRMTPSAFLQTSDVVRAFLAAAIRLNRRDLCDLLSEANHISVVELLIHNADSVFAPLFLERGQALSDGTSFANGILMEQKTQYGLQQLLMANHAALILGIAMRSDLEHTNIEQIKRTLLETMALVQPGAPAAILSRLTRSALTIIGMAGDILRGQRGRKQLTERLQVLKALDVLMDLIGPPVFGAVPQIMSILQFCVADASLRGEAFSLWHRLFITLTREDVIPLLAQTTATVVQLWPNMSEKHRKLSVVVIAPLLEQSDTLPTDALHTIADFGDVPELKHLQDAMAARRHRQTFADRVSGFLQRLQTIDDAMLVQSLQEMRSFLITEKTSFARLATSSTIDPLLGRTAHALLQVAIRTSENPSQARSLALRCMGILGALDPDRLPFPEMEHEFVPQHDLRETTECMAFALYSIEHVLLKALRTTHDPQQQNAYFLAIKGMAAVCNFDERVFKGGQSTGGVEASIRERWKKVHRNLQEALEPILNTSMELQHAQHTVKAIYPLYRSQRSYREWLQAWTTDLTHTVSRLPSKTLPGPAQLFEPFTAVVRRSTELTTSRFLLPFLVFYGITAGAGEITTSIRTELTAILEDQVLPQDLAMSTESRSLCAQTIFELLDHLNTWVRARQVYLNERYRRLHRRPESEYMLEPAHRIEMLIQSLPQDSLAAAALSSKSYARALLNYEKTLYKLKSMQTPEELQPYWEKLHLIYAELQEPDSMQGVSVSIISPSLQHQIREHEMTGHWTSAQSCWEVQLQISPDDADAHMGLLRCLRNLGHYDSLNTHISGLQAKDERWTDLLLPYEIDAALNAGDALRLQSVIAKDTSESAESAFGAVMLAYQDGQDVEVAVCAAAERLGHGITTSSKDAYRRFYDAIVKMQMLHEFAAVLSINQVDNSARRKLTSEINDQFASSLQTTASAFKTRESILNMRRNAYRFINGSSDPEIGDLWLSTSKIALKADHIQTAYSAILQARQMHTDYTFIQSAKLYKAGGHVHRALQELNQGLAHFGVLDGPTQGATYATAIARRLAKATLKSARWMSEVGRYSEALITTRFKRACLLAPEWEAVYYRYGQWADEQLQKSPLFISNPTPGTRDALANSVILGRIEIVIHQFAKALRFGSKYVYQSLPRLLTLWLDMGAWPEVLQIEREGVLSKEKVKQRRTSDSKGKDKVGQESMIEQLESVYGRIQICIRRAGEKLPSYMWLSALPQLISRINHESKRIRDLIALLCDRVVREFPDQAAWMLVSTMNSDDAERVRHCRSLLERSQRVDRGNDVVRAGQLQTYFQRFWSFILQFFQIAQYPTQSTEPLSVTRNFPALKQLVPNKIVIPLQRAMTVTFPSDAGQTMQYKPFPTDLAVFAGFEDSIEIMPSIAKPRKLVVRGSDGKLYRFLCKPTDDLRKDSRLMECTSLINRLLQRDAESRKRGLHVRTYAVVPLNDKTGLIEWVPDTNGIRHLLEGIYRTKSVNVWSEPIKAHYGALKPAFQNNELAKCGAMFRKTVLPLIKPVFHEYFLDNFPEPSAWFRARNMYARTYAVMTMVGYVLGLGDRHLENILLDTTTGACVHVDYNCLFGMGFVHFEIQEKVPFRLTQNVIDGFGVTGVEGIYRICSEITLRILRSNKTPLVSVLESFIHDPLLNLGLSVSNSKRKSIGVARGESAEATKQREAAKRTAEARSALSTLSHKLSGTISTTRGEPSSQSVGVEATIDILIQEATDPGNLGGMYIGWGAWI